jgi:hypothetical protein
MRITNRLIFLLPLWLLLVLGCSGGSKGTAARLSGSVKYKGTAVTAGMITFIAKSEDGKAAGTYLAPINADGTYSIAQLPAGEFQVAIETESANPKRASSGPYQKMQGPRPEKASSAEAAKGAYVKIPSKYADPKKSGLTVTLTSGKNTKDFDLTD